MLTFEDLYQFFINCGLDEPAYSELKIGFSIFGCKFVHNSLKNIKSCMSGSQNVSSKQN